MVSSSQTFYRSADRNDPWQILGRIQPDYNRRAFAEARNTPEAVMSLHLGTKARWTQLQPVPDLVDLIQDLLGRLIRHGASARVAEDKGAVSLHINASHCGPILEMLLPFFVVGVAFGRLIHAIQHDAWAKRVLLEAYQC